MAGPPVPPAAVTEQDPASPPPAFGPHLHDFPTNSRELRLTPAHSLRCSQILPLTSSGQFQIPSVHTHLSLREKGAGDSSDVRGSSLGSASLPEMVEEKRD